jgi:4-amino-4-deoxy-L-arabinose transferase-like glycosyltransferase
MSRSYLRTLTSWRSELIILATLALLVFALRLPSLEQPFDNDSGANAYHARLIVNGEPLYGTHHPAHHMPAVYYIYALAFLMFGDSVWAVKLLLILWTIATVYLLYRLGALLMNKSTGFLAAVFYAILTSHVLMWGTSAEIELFANLPRIAAVLVLIHLFTQHAAAWKFLFVGLISATAFLFKVIYLSPLAMAGFVLLGELWQTRSTAGAWRATVMRGLWIGVGFVTGLLPVVAYFTLSGLLPRLLLVFTLGRGYINYHNTIPASPQYSLLYPLFGLAMNNAALLTFSLASLLIIVSTKLLPRRCSLSFGWDPIPRGCLPKRHRSGQDGTSPIVFYVAIWYILSFVETGINRIFFLHYYLLIVPPLSLLAAWFLLRVCRDVKRQIRTASRFAATQVLVTLLTIALFISVAQNFNYYQHYVRYKLKLETYQNFLLGGWPAAGQRLVQVQALADYVQEHTALSDRIYYWSADMQLYYLADRRCPIDIIWPLYAEATGPYQRIFVPLTKYVILDEGDNGPRPDWLYAELAKKYRLEMVIGDQEIYRFASYD